MKLLISTRRAQKCGPKHAPVFRVQCQIMLQMHNLPTGYV